MPCVEWELIGPIEQTMFYGFAKHRTVSTSVTRQLIRRNRYMTNVKRTSKRPYLLSAALFFLAAFAANAQTLNCTAAPYNVPAGLPTASTTSAQDQAQLMCQQHLLFPTATSNPPLTDTRV